MLRSKRLIFAAGLIFLVSLYGCGSGGSDSSNESTADENVSLAPQAAGTISGVLLEQGGSTGLLSVQSAADDTWPMVTFDQQEQVPVAFDGSFMMSDVPVGDHSLYFTFDDGTTTELPVRMHAGGGLNLGTVHIGTGAPPSAVGYDGYMFGYVDADGDGINDNFSDVDGDGICDEGFAHAGFPYFMDQGYVDGDGNGVNDRFIDADGDGINDLTGMEYGHGFGWVDEDGDGINDRFVDADGDGICDLAGTPFSHPFGFIDEDGDGINDLFVDADGDGINDVNQMPYRGMPGFVDLDGDGLNDYFADANGDGINDLTGMSFGHGFGWVDVDGDGINDRFVDANGDGVVDVVPFVGPKGGTPYGIGYHAMHYDQDGNGIDDVTGISFGHGFGWVDADGDGINDMFVDADGDGVNDVTGIGYQRGYMGGGTPGAYTPPGTEWPHSGGGPGMGGGYPGSGMGVMM